MSQGQAAKLTFQSRRQIAASSRTPARMEPTKIHRETLKSSLLPPSGEMRSSICGDETVSQHMLFHYYSLQLAAVCYRCAFRVHPDGRFVVLQHQSRSTSNHHRGGVAVVLQHRRASGWLFFQGVCGYHISILSQGQRCSLSRSKPAKLCKA